jgi:hypothetical protein
MRIILHWAPRIIAILQICFIGIFSLDVFTEGYDAIEVIVGFLMHNIPSFILIALLLVAWKWPLKGGVGFLLLGGLSVLFFNTFAQPIVFLIVSLPVIVTGALFVLDGWKRK